MTITETPELVGETRPLGRGFSFTPSRSHPQPGTKEGESGDGPPGQRRRPT